MDICRLAMACNELPDNGGDRPQLVVTIDWETLRQQAPSGTLDPDTSRNQVGARLRGGRFDDGAWLSAPAVRRIACDAAVLPAVLGGAGQVLDIGRTRRLFTGPLRRALVVRDRGCAFPGCDRPPRWSEGHHIVSWVDGGATALHNAVLVCGHHHRVIHRGEWSVRINRRDGLPEFIPPAYVDPERLPQRNQYHRRE